MAQKRLHSLAPFFVAISNGFDVLWLDCRLLPMHLSLAYSGFLAAETQRAGVRFASLPQAHRAETVRVVRWDGGDEEEIFRPTSFDELQTCLQALGMLLDNDVLYYFPRNKIGRDASNRKPLNSAVAFEEWHQFDTIAARLPTIWIYPKVAGRSPDQAPRMLTDDRSSSASGASSVRRRRVFTASLNELDRVCCFPGCDADFSTPEHSGSGQAAHILPHRLRKLDRNHHWLLEVLDAAVLGLEDIDNPRNGFMLCATHHASFDHFGWSLDNELRVTLASTDAVSIAAGAGAGGVDSRPQVALAHRRDFGGQSPSSSVWLAYNKYIYADKAAKLDTYLAQKGVTPGSAAAGDASADAAGSGGGAGAESAGGAGSKRSQAQQPGDGGKSKRSKRSATKS